MQGDVETVTWQVPPFTAPASQIVSWVESQIQEAEGYLEGQPSYKNLASNLRIFNAVFKDSARSNLITNGLKYNINKFCTTLAEVREIAAFGSDVPAYKKMAEMLTKVSKCIYLESDFPFQILKVLQYATVMGIGYLWPKVRATEYGYGPRKLQFDPLGLLDVMPTQIPSRSNDIQDAYSVTIYDYMPIAEAHGRFPLWQGKLQTVGTNNYKTLLQARRQDFAAAWRYGDLQDTGKRFGDLYTEIRYTFVRDIRINTTGFELPMGDPGTTWFYKVPFLGMPIFGGMRDGKPYMRPAMSEDCRIYPGLRLIITSNGIDRPIYDGPAFDWDPKFPVIQYTVDDWAWEPLGRSLVGDVASIETTIRKHERLVDQVISARLDPPMGYDIDQTGGAKIERFDLFEPKVRLGLQGEPGKTFQSIMPNEVNVGANNWDILKYLNEKELAQLGLNDVGNLANLKINVASDTAEKMLDAIGPVAKGIAMRIEKANKQIGERIKYLIPQWFDANRIIEYIGPDNIAKEMFDFNPDDMVPSHLPDEFINGEYPEKESMYDKLTRAKFFVRKLRLVSVPSTLLKITAMQRQLLMLQLKARGAPIGWCDVFEVLDIQNYGQVPGNTVRERWFNEELEMQKLKILAEVAAQKFMKEVGLEPPPQQPAGKGGKGGGTAPGGQHAGGRPPSDKKPPRLVAKGAAGGNPRTVVKTS